MTPHPRMSAATAGVGMKRVPGTDGSATSDSSEAGAGAVSPNSSRNRGPAGRNSDAGVIDGRAAAHPAAGTPDRSSAPARGRRAAPHGARRGAPCPVVEHVRDRRDVGDPEGHVQIGEPVTGIDGERAHQRPRDPFIPLRDGQQPFAERIWLLDGEHGTAIVVRLPGTAVQGRRCVLRPWTDPPSSSPKCFIPIA